MTRPLRIQFPGAFYHVTNRGNAKRSIFKDDEDRNRFLKILSQSVQTYSVHLHCFVLMKNHFHLLVETPLGNLGEFMRQFNISYTSHYNRRHKRVGHLYQGRYKSILVEKDSYLTMLSRYIHLNPVKTAAIKKLVPEQRLQYLWAYKWSSLPGYLNLAEQLDFLNYDTVLAEYGGGIQSGMDSYKQELVKDLNTGLNIKNEIIGQSILGGKEFVSRIKVLYKYASLNNREVGELFEVDYSTVSQSRKRLLENAEKNETVKLTFNKIETILSRIKI
ncbi:MAG: transposase [Deltaproteobacteria bacterium]|nr:transposase [Deltaproteobacteria bacterium]